MFNSFRVDICTCALFPEFHSGLFKLNSVGIKLLKLYAGSEFVFDYLKLFYYLLNHKTIFIRRRSGALGDDLLMSLVLPALKEKYPDKKIVVEARWVDFFQNNPYVDWVTDKHFKTTKRHLKPKYAIDENTKDSIYKQFMQSIGLQGKAAPQLYLTDTEIQQARDKYDFPYIVICPVGKVKFSANRKEWGLEKFQKLRDLMPGYRFIQIGLKTDPLLKNVNDARGLAVRQSAALIKNGILFIGLEGGLMHLAKAVGKKSVIIYGGFLRPEISAYEENLNISNLVDCSPCFHSAYPHEPCETMKCMAEITPQMVYEEINHYLSDQKSG